MKANKPHIFLLFFVFPFLLFPQSTQIPKYFTIGSSLKNEKSLSIYVENDGTYYLGGLKNDSALIMCFNNSDDVVWSKTFKFSTQACYVNYIGKSSDGSIIGTAVAFDNRHYSTCFKVNPNNGNFIWNTLLTGNNNYLNKIFEKNPNEYICVGAEYPTGGSQFDVKIAVVSAITGSLVNQRQCIGYQPYNWLDDVEGVTELRNGSFFSSGRTYLQNVLDKMRSNLIKYDSQGNVIWAKYLHKNSSGTSRMYTRDLIYFSPTKILLQYVADDNCSGSCNDYCPGLMLIDTSGTVIWDKIYNIPASNGELTDKVCIMGNSIYVTGFTNLWNPSSADVFVLKTDLNGNLQDCRRFGSSTLNEKPYFNAIAHASDAKNGLLYFTSSAENNNGFSDISVFKLDSTLNLPCAPGATLAVTTQSYAPFQTTFPLVYSPNVITANSLNNFNTTLTNTCLATSTRIIDTINVRGNDTILNVFSSSATSYNWQNGVSTYSILVNSTGVDSVLITQGCCATVNHVFYVKICGLLLSVSSNTSICTGDVANLAASGAPSYTWNPGALVAPSITVSPISSTIYTVSTNNSLGCSLSKTVNVNVNPKPTINVTSSSMTLCSGNSATLIASGANSYTWNPGSVIGQSITVSPSSNVTYTVFGTNLSGCSNAQTVSLSVAQSPSLTVTTNSSNICIGGSSTLTASGSSSYSWSPGGLTGSSVIVTPTTSITYSVITTNTLNCSATKTVAVLVNPNPILTIVGSPSVLCIGNSATITANGAQNYTWNPVGASGNSIIISPTTNTTYSITGVNTQGCSNTSIINITVSQTPTISVNNSTICLGQSTATLTANGATSYTWSPSSGLNTTYGNSVIATPTVNQTYTVIGSSSNNCISTNTTTVIVNPLPSISVNNASICESQQQATLSANGGITYIWSPSGSLSSASGSVVTSSPASSQNYTITGVDLNGCTNTTTALVTLFQLPTIFVNNISCSGAETTTISASGAVSYSWAPTVGLSSTTGSIVTFNSNNGITYTVSGTDVNGCINSAVTSSANTAPTPSLTINTSTICLGQQTATLIAQGANSYTWAPAVALSSTTGSIVLSTPTIQQTYTVTGTNASGCSSVGTTTVFIKTPGNITVNSSTICLGQQSATLIANGANSYTWSPSNGLNNLHSNIVLASPNISQNYTVSGIDGNGCIANGISNLTVYNLPFVSAGSDQQIEYGDSIQLTGFGNGVLYWITGNNLICNHCTSPFVVPTENSCYVLEVVGSYDCINHDTLCITVNLDDNLYIPNCFTPNNDGVNDYFMAVGYGITEFELSVFDRWGELIFSSTSLSNGWDGSYKGKPCQDDVYTYLVKYTTISKKYKENCGHVTLLGKNK